MTPTQYWVKEIKTNKCLPKFAYAFPPSSAQLGDPGTVMSTMKHSDENLQ
jgi:hypothetical protein